MADKVKNQIIVLEPSTPSVTELLKLVNEKGLADVLTCSSPEEAIQCLSGALPCLLITSLTDNSVVPPRVQLLKRLEAVIKQGALKVYMVTGMKNRQLADLFTQKLGVTDYIIDPVPARTMFFKVNLAIKAVDTFRKIAEQKKAASEQIVIKKSDAKKPDAAAAAAVPAKGKPALQMAEDTFLFKNGGVKKAGKKFVVEVEGPDPSTGEWKPHEDKGDAKSAWRWIPNEEKEAQEKGKAPPDGWVHKGEKPVFNEESGKWALSSEKPQLALQKAGKVVAEKVGVDDSGEVVVAEDSPAAEANLKKNKEKAALAIKAREESKKTLKADAGKAQENETTVSQKGGGEGDGDTPEEKIAGGKPALSVKDPGSAKRAPSPKAKLSLAEQLGGDDESGEEGWQEEKGEFKNKLDGKKEQLRSVQDKRSGAENAEDTTLDPREAEKPGSDEEKPRSPLDFLKKKKELLEKNAKARPESDDLYEDGGKPIRERSVPEPAAKEKKKGLSAIDKLARLKAGLEDSPTEGEGEDWEEEKGDFHNHLDGTKETHRSVVDRRDGRNPKTGKKAGKDDEEGPEAAAPAKTRERLARKKKDLDHLKAKLREPLAETLSPEEEEAVREELGLQNRPEIKVKDLVKRKRAAEAARLKALLAEIEEDERKSEDEGEVITNGLRSKTKDDREGPTAHDLSAEKLKGIRAAIDGGDLDSFGEEAEERKKRREQEAKDRKGLGLEDDAFYLPEDELLPKGNAWESAGDWYVYLNVANRYKGFDKIESLLPLWIFKGDKVPELLDRSKQWRFYGGKPVQAKTAADVPIEVRDYLLGLRDQVNSHAEEKENAKEPLATSTQEEKKAKEKNSSSSLLDKLKQRLEDDAFDSEDEAASLEEESHEGSEPGKPSAEREETSASEIKADRDGETEEDLKTGEAAAGKGERNAPEQKKGKKSGNDASIDALARLRQKLGDDEPGETASSHDEKNEEAESSLDRLRRELEGDDESPEETRDEKSPKGGKDSGETKEAGEPEPVSSGKPSKEKAAFERLKARLDEASEPEENEAEEVSQAEEAKPSAARQGDEPTEDSSDNESTAGEFGGERNEAMRRLRDKLIENSEESESSPDSPSSGVDEKNPPVAAPTEAASEGVKKFMERRKSKEKTAPKANAAKPDSSSPVAAFSVYLGIFVAVSDALNLERTSVAMPRVLKAFEDSFGNCRALCLGSSDSDGMAKVSYASEAVEEISIKLNTGTAEPISMADGGSEKVMGYLFLQPKGERSTFSESELHTFQRVAAMLWPILARDPAAEKVSA